MCIQTDVPPEGVDPGQWALDRYRAWRRIHMGDSGIPPISSLEEMLMNMREEPPEQVANGKREES
jgi:hypothetical protein